MVWCKIKYFSFSGRSLPHHLLPSCGPHTSDLVLTTAQVYPPTFTPLLRLWAANVKIKSSQTTITPVYYFTFPPIHPHFHVSQFHVPCFQRASHLRAKMSSSDLYFIDYRIRNWVTTTHNSITPPMSRRPDKAVFRYSASTDCIWSYLSKLVSMADLWNRAGYYIFIMWFLPSFPFFFLLLSFFLA